MTHPPTDPDTILCVDEVAAILRASKPQVRAWTRAELLKNCTPARRNRVYRWRDVLAFCEAQAAKKKEHAACSGSSPT